MKILKVAAVAAMLPMTALAQATDTEMMGAGLTMLGTAVGNEFDRLGIEADPATLTVGQLATIHSIINSDQSPSEMTRRIEAVIDNN